MSALRPMVPGPLPGAQHANYAGATHATVHFDAPGLELLGDQLRGAVLLHPELRVGVNIAPDLGQVGMKLADLVENGRGWRHGASLAEGRESPIGAKNCRHPRALQRKSRTVP